jgi:hypothetical protein
MTLHSAAARAGLAILALGLSAAAAGAQDLVRSEDAIVALFSLQTEFTVDVKVLARLEERYDRNRQDRSTATQRLAGLYVDMERLFEAYRAARRSAGRGEEGSEPADPREIPRLEQLIEEKELELMGAEGAIAALQDDGRRLREQIRDKHEQMAILMQQIETLRASLPTQRESVTGIWDITLLPGGEKGVFALFQSGTVVSGQYVLDGPFRGSLDGTLIDRRLLLQRIDDRLGRSMDLTAFLSPDGQSLRGTWENYDLANGQTRTGSWAARRRQARAAPEGDPAPGEGGS